MGTREWAAAASAPAGKPRVAHMLYCAALDPANLE